MPFSPRQNRLLAALPEADFKRWSPQLEAVALTLGQELHSPGVAAVYAYFPTTAVVSLLHRMAGGGWAEAALVGREGIVGLPIFMGGESAPSLAVVRAAGAGVRLDAEWLKAECRNNASAMPILLRYAQALMAQMAQTSICNRHHALGQQLCRRLLLFLDRVDGNRLKLTHEQLAEMLGVRRSGITECALRLQELGLIRYARGHITVHDRRSLEDRSCECYRVVEQEYERLLPSLAPCA